MSFLKDNRCHLTGGGREGPGQDPFLCTRSRVMGRRLPSQSALGRLSGWDSQDVVPERVTLMRTSCRPTQGQAPARDEEGFAWCFPSRSSRAPENTERTSGGRREASGWRRNEGAQQSSAVGECDPPGDEKSGCGHWVRPGNSGGSQLEGHCGGLPRNPKSLNFCAVNGLLH